MARPAPLSGGCGPNSGPNSGPDGYDGGYYDGYDGGAGRPGAGTLSPSAAASRSRK
ncbi:hypothetical protein ABZU75_32245 [Streptosporangium sp. NPDC005286]|uniref:hypothetical protein n=1 Tax=Streptosporangium sp. NPDC005286 TaxID=3154463 RepID=UPI0033B777FA